MNKPDKIDKNSNRISLSNIMMLWIISFIFIYLDSYINPKIPVFVKSISNNYSILLSILDTLLVLFLITAFKLKNSGNLTIFFKKKDKGYLIQALKDAGFKKGEILTRWPFYLSAIFILIIGGTLLSSTFNEGLIYSPKVYLFLMKSGIFQFTNFLGQSILFFAIFDYFLDMSRSRKWAYIYSAIFLLIAGLAAKLFNGDITVVWVLQGSFIIAPWMMAMYYWADNSIYYSWILMSTIQTLLILFYAIQFNIV